MNPIYRAEHVGSLLRPAELLAARAARAEGKITEQELRAVEDRAVLAALGKQRSAGLELYTDGEMRRGSWLTDVADARRRFRSHQIGPRMERSGRRHGGKHRERCRREAAEASQDDRARSAVPQKDFAGAVQGDAARTVQFRARQLQARHHGLRSFIPRTQRCSKTWSKSCAKTKSPGWSRRA